MKKVIHVLNSNSYSGAENVAITICKLANKYKHIYCSPKGSIEQILSEKNIEYECLNRNLNVFSLRKVLKKYLDDEVIIHAHDFKASIICVICSMVFKNIKIVSHIHKNDPEMKKVSFKSLLYRIFMAKFTAILVVSESIISESFFSFPRSKTFVLSNVLDYDEILLKSKEPVSERMDLIFVGRMVESKDPERFVEIVKIIKKTRPNIKAYMIGSGNLESTVRELIAQNKLQKNVTLISFQDNPYKYINYAKILVMTSKWEGFGLVALESMLLSVPVVCPPIGGLINIVDDKTGCLCNSNSEFADCILTLLTNKEIYRMKSKNSLKKAKKINDLAQFTNRLENIYSGKEIS